MNLVPRRVVVPIAIAAVVLCGAVAPIQWSQGNTARALFLSVLALTSLGGLWSTLRRPATQPVPSRTGRAGRAGRAVSVGDTGS